MDTEDFMSKLEEAGVAFANAIGEAGEAMGKAFEAITDICDVGGDEADASEDNTSSANRIAKQLNEGTFDVSNCLYNTDKAASTDDTDDDTAWGEANDKLDNLIDSFNKALDSTLDGAQGAIDKLLADDGEEGGGADDGEDDADAKESTDESPSAESLIADTVSGAVDVISTAITDSLGLIDKFVEQSLDIAQKAQDGETHTDEERDVLDKGKDSIIAVSKMMQTVVKGGVDALQGMVKSYADAVKGKTEE